VPILFLPCNRSAFGILNNPYQTTFTHEPIYFFHTVVGVKLTDTSIGMAEHYKLDWLNKTTFFGINLVSGHACNFLEYAL